MNRHQTLSLSIMFITIACRSAHGYDVPHFYRATRFFGEPRLDRSTLSTFDIVIGAQSTRSSRNSEGKGVPLLDLYGPHNMSQLGTGVPGLDPTNPLDLILINLSRVSARDNFATFSIQGKFSIVEAHLLFSKNLPCSFFVQTHLPVSSLSISKVCFKDCSPTDDICPNINTPEWQLFLNNFDAILKRYDLNRCAVRTADIGDITVSCGWAHCFVDFDTLDFIDVEVKIGVLFPSSRKKDIDRIFELSHGYDGHIGAPLSLSVAAGAFEWVTIGGHIEVIPFVRKRRCIRLKTHQSQSSIIKLTKAEGTFERGNFLTGSIFLKADHCIRSASILLGYSFSHKERDNFTPCSTKCINMDAICSDESLDSWRMHTAHFELSYDFSKHGKHIGFNLGFFYDWNAGGRRIFQTDMAGGTFGLNMVWDF